jgi:glycosyltransferase involved in cell wall biosynthesis
MSPNLLKLLTLEMSKPCGANTAARISVLLSAFACEPGIGSEPEVGWQWALQLARFHDVTVLTQSKNQPAIEKELSRLRGSQSEPRFVFHSLSERVQRLRRHTFGFKLHYVLWQKSAQAIVATLHRERPFALMHHITFAGFRYPTAVWGRGVPAIWGPVGGAESIPVSLLPWRHPVSLLLEGTRNFHNFLHANRFSAFTRRARASTLLLATTREMQQLFARFGFSAEIMPTIGIHAAEFPWREHRTPEGPLKLLFVGNMQALKGIDLALEALSKSGAQAAFTLVGDGAYRNAAERLTARLGLQDRVVFTGRLPREKVLQLYAEHDLLLFPSLHDTGGYAVIEAMLNQLPVICLDCAGPALAVGKHCGRKIPLGPRHDVIAGLSAAIAAYDQNRTALIQEGVAARQAVLQNYDWTRKAERMNELYRAAVGKNKP